MNKHLTLASLLILSIVAYGYAQQDEPPTDELPKPTEQTPQPLIEPAKLEPKRINVQYVEEEAVDLAAIEAHREVLYKKNVKLTKEHRMLIEATQAIGEQTGLKVIVNWRAAEVVGIEPSDLLIYGQIELSAKHLLELLLEDVSADVFDDDKLGYRIRPSGIYISTQREINNLTTTRIYDIRPLIRYHFMPLGLMLDDFRAADVEAFEAFINRGRDNPLSDNRTIEQQKDQIKELSRLLKLRAKELSEELDLDRDRLLEAMERAIKKANQIKGGGGLFFADADNDGGDEWSVQEYYDQLLELITRSVGNPDEWLDEESTLTEQGGRFIVKTTPENHRLLEKLLNGLLQSCVQRQVAVLTDMRIMRILHEAYEASLDGELGQAMDLVKEARQIDPNHETAFAMQVLIQDMSRKAVNPSELARRRLIRKITISLDFPTIDESIKALSDMTNAPIEVNWNAVAKVGVKPDLAVGCVYLNRPGNAVLRDLLEQVSADLEARDKLEYVIRDGKVKIDTRANLSR